MPEELQQRQERKAQLAQAGAEIEARAVLERAEYERKLAARDATRASGKKPRGQEPQPPCGASGPKDQVNFTDPESRIMPVSGGFLSEAAVRAAERRVRDLEKKADPRTGPRRSPGPKQWPTASPPKPDAPDTSCGNKLSNDRRHHQSSLRFRAFRLRGLAGAVTKWTLATLACNLRRLPASEPTSQPLFKPPEPA
jgi:hypothetical protein